MPDKLRLRARALGKALDLAASNKGETTAEQLVADAFVISAYLKGLPLVVRADEFGIQRIYRSFAVHQGNSDRPKPNTARSSLNCLSPLFSHGKVFLDYCNKAFSRGLVRAHRHKNSSSVLADGESGDSVAADPRNDATPDTSAKGVRDDG